MFAEAFEEVCSGFAGLLPGPLEQVVFDGDERRLTETGWAQPALFAFEVGVFRLLGSWGVRPDFVAGHSIGELAAAYVAGVWSLPDACRVVAARAGLMQVVARAGCHAGGGGERDRDRRGGGLRLPGGVSGLRSRRSMLPVPWCSPVRPRWSRRWVSSGAVRAARIAASAGQPRVSLIPLDGSHARFVRGRARAGGVQLAVGGDDLSRLPRRAARGTGCGRCVSLSVSRTC